LVALGDVIYRPETPPPRVYATPGALKASRRLLPNRPIECRVQEELLAGRVERLPDDGRFVAVIDGVSVLLERKPGSNGREGWEVFYLTPRLTTARTRVVEIHPGSNAGPLACGCGALRDGPSPSGGSASVSDSSTQEV
jgi:hypothetical protein